MPPKANTAGCEAHTRNNNNNYSDGVRSACLLLPGMQRRSQQDRNLDFSGYLCANKTVSRRWLFRQGREIENNLSRFGHFGGLLVKKCDQQFGEGAQGHCAKSGAHLPFYIFPRQSVFHHRVT